MGGSARAEIYGEGGSGGDGEEEKEEEEVVAVESKWTNISQMVALLFVTVAAEGGGARARSSAAPANSLTSSRRTFLQSASVPRHCLNESMRQLFSQTPLMYPGSPWPTL